MATSLRLPATILVAILVLSPVRPAEPPARLDAQGDSLPDGAVARLGSTLLSPGKTIEMVRFSHDGKRLALWTWGGPDPGGRLIIANAVTGREMLNKLLPCQFLQMRWLADGHGLAVVKLGKKDFYIWDFTDEKNALPYRDRFENVLFENDPQDAAVSPDGRWLAVDRRRGDAGVRAVELLAVVPNAPLEKLAAHALDVGAGWVSITFSPDSRYVFVLRRERKPGLPPVTAWGIGGISDLAEGARLTVYEVASRKQVAAFRVAGPLMNTAGVDVPRQALSPDGKTLYVGDDAGAVHAYDWAAGREIRSFVLHAPPDPKNHEVAGIRSLAIGGDGRTLFSVGPSYSVSMTDVTAEKPAGRRVGPDWRVEQVVAAPDGTRVAAAGSNVSGRVTFLDAKTGADLLPRPGHVSMIGSVAVSPDATVVTVAGFERTVCWWDAEHGRELRRKRIDGTGSLLYPMLTADGRGVFAVAAGDIDYIDLESGRTTKVAKGPIAPWPQVMGVNGSTVIHTANGEKVGQWNAATRRAGIELPRAGQLGLAGPPAAMSPDGHLVVVLGAKWMRQGKMGFFHSSQILFYDAATGEAKRRWQTNEARLECAAWSGDNRHFLVAGGPAGGGLVGTLDDELPISAKSALLLFDARTAEPLRSFEPVAHVERRPLWITAAVFSPDGKFFAIGQIDGSVHVYELATGRPIRTFRGHRNQVSQLAFAADGRRLISVSHDMTGLVWDSSPAHLAKADELTTDTQRHGAWTRLAAPEWEIAGPAAAALGGRPDELVALVRERMPSAAKPSVDAEAVAKFVAQLDDPLFAARERAAVALRRLDREALPLLQGHLARLADAESRKRLQRIIREIAADAAPSDRLRETRVVTMLEQANTDAARVELKRLAAGHPDAPLTLDAATALKRVEAK